MDPRDELQSLRRLAELEAKARGGTYSPAPERAPNAITGPQEDPGFAQTALIGAGRTVDRLSKGLQQIYYGVKGDQPALDLLKQNAADDDAAYKPLQDARPFAAGLGEAVPSMILPAGGGATLLASAGRMAAAGAIPGALEYGTAGERAQRGLLGAAAGAAVPALVVAGKTAASLAEPLYQGGRNAIAGRTLNRVAGQGAPQVAQRLASAGELVPGSVPTAAQVANNGGIAALERSAASANPAAYTQRAQEQASARLSALRGVAGDDAQMAAAKAARKAASDHLYTAADAGIAPIDGFFGSLLQRPQFASAVSRAQELAKDKGLSDIFFRDAKGNPQALIGEGAHLIKKALDEAGEFGSKSYTGKASAGAANDTNGLFQQWLDKSIPEYAQARQAFAKGSEPVNQMQVGQSLFDSVSPALADFGALGKETAASYARALRNADQTAAKATGMSGKTMADVLTPQQMQAVTSVAQDLARKANAQDLGRGVGSNTFQNLAMQNVAEQSGMPRLVGGLLGLPGVSRATNWIYRTGDEKMQDMLAQTLLNPRAAAALMQASAKPVNKTVARKLLEQSALRAGLLGAPALQGTVSP